MAAKKKWTLLFAIGACIIVLIIGVSLLLKFYKVDFNKKLPMTVTLESDDAKPEDVAYKFWMELITPYEESNVPPWAGLNDVRFNKFQLLAGDKKDFAIEATFWVKPKNEMWSIFHNWGTKQKDGTIQDIHWTMRIKNVGKNKFRLTKIEETSNTVAGQAPVKEHYQKEAGIKVDDENNGYTIENGKLKVTYDNRKHWHKVPIKIDELFEGEYNGEQDTLIPGSFVITPTKTAFVIVEKERQIETGQPEPEKIKIVYSVDRGDTWKEGSVPMTFPSVRIRMIGFTSKQNGYLIVTSDRTMNFESHVVFKTNDGGKSWKAVGSVPDVNSLVTDGGFTNDKLGFISFGSKNEMDKQPSPYLFRTSDGGRHWDEVEVPIPSEYQGIFTVAQVPVFDGSQGTLLVNQGPSGDFQGGKVLAKFISIDKGMTWNFANLVDPDQVLSK
ncbi:hypothetical protein [Priestia megaterium]|uniref:hypothetical protein n=1 Tax=Priestia megaterium TaxID=1404 RepID=UPI00159C85DE|nr:hypothetical protein [Priestia megaterium]